MLFLHGYKSCKESFYYQLTHFAKSYKVTAPDIVGFSKDRELTLDYFIDWVSDFILAEGLQDPIIVAHSFGARLCFKGIAQKKVPCKKLIVTGGAGINNSNCPRNMRKVRLYRAVKRVFPNFASKHFGSQEYRALGEIERHTFKNVICEDLQEYAKAVDCPALLIYGEDDSVTPIEREGKIFFSLLQSSRLLSMRGGHFCFCDYPHLFNSYVDNFLSE